MSEHASVATTTPDKADEKAEWQKISAEARAREERARRRGRDPHRGLVQQALPLADVAPLLCWNCGQDWDAHIHEPDGPWCHTPDGSVAWTTFNDIGATGFRADWDRREEAREAARQRKRGLR